MEHMNIFHNTYVIMCLLLQIEEASAEEEELLGKNNDLEEGEEGEDGNTIVRDEELIKVLVSHFSIF